MRLAVSRLGGGARLADSDIGARTVVVEYERGAVDVDAIRCALLAAGYDSTVIG